MITMMVKVEGFLRFHHQAEQTNDGGDEQSLRLHHLCTMDTNRRENIDIKSLTIVFQSLFILDHRFYSSINVFTICEVFRQMWSQIILMSPKNVE